MLKPRPLLLPDIDKPVAQAALRLTPKRMLGELRTAPPRQLQAGAVWINRPDEGIFVHRLSILKRCSEQRSHPAFGDCCDGPCTHPACAAAAMTMGGRSVHLAQKKLQSRHGESAALTVATFEFQSSGGRPMADRSLHWWCSRSITGCGQWHGSWAELSDHYPGPGWDPRRSLSPFRCRDHGLRIAATTSR